MALLDRDYLKNSKTGKKQKDLYKVDLVYHENGEVFFVEKKDVLPSPFDKPSDVKYLPYAWYHNNYYVFGLFFFTVISFYVIRHW